MLVTLSKVHLVIVTAADIGIRDLGVSTAGLHALQLHASLAA
jgi:hypothetical protein